MYILEPEKIGILSINTGTNLRQSELYYPQYLALGVLNSDLKNRG